MARFDQDTLEVETARYFDDGTGLDVFAEEGFVSVPGRLIRDVGFFLVPASRSWDRMLSFSSELFRRVIRSAGGLPAETILNERDRLRAPQPGLEADERPRPIVEKVNEEVKTLLGQDTPLMLRITTTDSAGVLEAATPHFQTGGRQAVPAKREGSGLVSLQSLFLLLHFGQKRIEDGESFFLVLEEPELHLPPSVQRRLLARLQALSTQTIISTHSPLIAAYCDASSLLVIRNDDGNLSAQPLLTEPLRLNTTNPIRRLFQINRVDTATALMNDFVLVPEGRYDFDWLTLLLRVAELDRVAASPCSFGMGVGIIPTSDAKVRETCEALAKAHHCIVALVDGDDDGLRYADLLDEQGAGAAKVLMWPRNWAIEDLIGWIIEADEDPVMRRVNREIEPAPNDRTTLIVRLKTKDQALGKLKGDLVAYEIIANAISESPACVARVRSPLHPVSSACAAAPTPLFVKVRRGAGQIPRLVFTP